ncbi:arylamine N-acetyltransferase [Terasakiella sp. A23]|uniref:arylamine N-acetyltransferase family protein n=1 Tax=Terasakiella sp. FCG-A23 TaxID=3080561 RepID=UPI0029539901|nr:arylamine N-acetyltransferase [Terasakiella sp. A23]MDV7340759.1 arylamine N-acetyltransferase [Terasakiella sp. A23]
MNNITARYLNKLDINPDQSPLELLYALAQKHLATFSFNNLDVLLNPGDILSLETDDLADKIIDRGRGGYCFEHNKLMFHVLEELGFETSAQLARVIYNREGDFPRTHRVSIVNISNDIYLLDVGFGPYTPSAPISLSGQEVYCPNGERYRIQQNQDGHYQLELFKDGAFFILYRFELANYTDADFKMANFYTNCHPASKFVNELVISLKGADNTTFMAQNTLTTVHDGHRHDQTIESEQGLKIQLETLFDIDLNKEELTKIYKVIRPTG